MPNPSCLRQTGTVALSERTSAFDPREFFQTCQRLYVWDGFRDRILAAAKTVESSPLAEIASFDLIRDANDLEIRRELPEDHVFEDASQFCAYLAGMIERQEGGADGDLLANGYANIFYVRGVSGEVFAVDVDWRAGYRRWFVNVCGLDGGRWRAGRRVFSRSC